MKDLRISSQLFVGFGLMVLLVLASSTMVWLEAYRSEARGEVARRSTTGAVALADAQSALWQLRYGFPQFMISEEAGRKKIVNDEPAFRASVDKALDAYAASNPSEEERRSLKALRDIYGKYMAARPRWFELYEGGKIEEAKEWRAATTTPFGAGTVKAFAELIELQQKASLANHELGLRELETTRRMMIGLALVAIVAGLAIATSIIRALTGQLGGEPDYAKDVAVRIAGGDLASPIHVRAGDTRSVLWAMQAMRDNLRTLVGQVVAGAHTVSDSSAQLAQANIDLSQRTEEQASTLEETASSLEELTSTVTQNAQNARQATQSAANASDIARKGGIVVGEVVATMNDISQSSRRISEIISVIDGIAFQTNILALNAAVEAARAGEQGRGFAVVAAEVRNLAQRSAAAAKEIKELIGESVDKVVEGTKLVDAAGKTMQEIVASVRTVTDLITEIASASQEQSAGIEQVNTAVAQMDHAVQQNASLVEEAAAATEAMALQAETLLGTVTQFKLGARSEPTERVATAFVPRPIVVLPRAADSLPAPARHGEPSRAQPTAGDAWRTF